MGEWYAMRTIPDKEQQAIELIYRVLPHRLWEQCRILKKQKLFRTGGKLLLNTEKMFPGYIFIQTSSPKELQDELDKARKFPVIIGSQDADMIPLEDTDLKFLQSICGENLQYEMGLSRVQVDEEGNIIRIQGVLAPYAEKIARKRLRKRYVLASVELFRRKEDILFGILLKGDQIAGERDLSAG